MINKKNLLGKTPDELGTRDAIHTAIVSVRAASVVRPGQRCNLNEHREAVPDSKGCGVADPFRREPILRGQTFWLLLCQDEVPNVQHQWDHPTIDFSAPTREAQRNKTLQRYAEEYGVTYEQLMDAAAHVVEKNNPAPYPGTKTAEEIKAVSFERYDFWGEWADETTHEFEDEGTACCPEPVYPYRPLFVVTEPTVAEAVPEVAVESA